MSYRHTLSRREREILALIACGLANKEIARELEMSLHTVKSHVRNILAKLGARNRTEAAVIAARADARR
jgi:DNA-binding NarL/FixJ family response regulator